MLGKRKKSLTFIYFMCVFIAVSSRKEWLDWFEQFKTAIQPSFSKSLMSISDMLETITLYEEDDPPNMKVPIHQKLVFTKSVVKSIESVVNSVTEADKICVSFLNKYNQSRFDLSKEFGISEDEIGITEFKLKQWRIDLDKWRSDTQYLEYRTNNLRTEIEDIYGRIQSLLDEITKEEKKLKPLKISLFFTLGFSGIGIKVVKNKIEKLKNEMNGLRANKDEQRDQLILLERNLRVAKDHKLQLEQNVTTTEVRLPKLKESLARLKTKNEDVIAFGENVRKVNIFVNLLKSKLKGIHRKQEVKFMLKPLLSSVDDLVQFLETNFDLVKLLGDNRSLERIRPYITQSLDSNFRDIEPPLFHDSETGRFLDFVPLESWDSESLKFVERRFQVPTIGIENNCQ